MKTPMIIGVPKEVKDHEARVALVPHGVTALREAGHRVIVQSQAGDGSAMPDSEYADAGAEIAASADEVWRRAELIIKVKEPQPSEYGFLRPGLTLFTYLHLAPLPDLTDHLLATRTTGIAYETITERGTLPLLTPMSEVAGRMSVQVGAQYLERPNGGRGILLGGVPGVAPANVVILGGGVVGTNAAKMALGLGARVSIIDRNLNRLRELDDIFGTRGLRTLASNSWTITETLRHADLVIGAVLIPGASAPRLVRRSQISLMKRGSVVVDVAIDQGGCFETSHATTHTDPIYFVDEVLHYCVSNMPAAVPNTSTLALTNATFPYLQALANKGVERAIDHNPGLAAGVNTFNGVLTNPAVAASQNREHRELSTLMEVNA